jgi:NitT/TauT family transport system permease protein
MSIQASGHAGPAFTAAPTPSFHARLGRWLAANAHVIVAFLAFFAAWEAAVLILNIAPFILPPPTTIMARLVQDWHMLAVHSMTTLQEVIIGFSLSIVVGLGLATLIVSNRTAEKLIMPFVISLKTVPKIALAPILIIWFGYGLMPKVAIAFLISFFPILIGAIIGLRSAEREMIQLVRSMGASTLQTFVKIRFPKALPSIFGGLRIGIVQAVIGAIVAEYLASESGLGYLQLIAQSRLDTPLLFSTVIVLSLLGVILFNLIVLAEKICMPWARNNAELSV